MEIATSPVARTPCPEARGEVSIVVCVAGVWQHT